MRYFLHLSYNGANYRGWQRQHNSLGVQEILEECLSTLFKEKLVVWGCGRTDALVHASQFYAHVDIESSWEFDAIFLINQALPHDIVVHEFIPVHEDANAQMDAIERTYDYYFHIKRDPFLCNFSTYYKEDSLDLAAMKKAVELLPQYEDFQAFCKRPDRHNHTRCKVTSALIEQNGTNYHFQISANRFLKGMIRVIVGHLLEVGRGNETVAEFENRFISKERSERFPVAYPQGLYLSKITYPYLDKPNCSTFQRGLF